jgi:pilus assembly protein CpaE
MTTIVEGSPDSAQTYLSVVGADAEVVQTLDLLKRHLAERPRECAVVLGPNLHLEAAAKLAAALRVSRPALSVILLRHRVDTPVLTEALRSGMREVVEDRDLTGLAQAVRRAKTLYEALSEGESSSAARPVGKIVTVFAAKGGVGKTTVATNLAVLLAERHNTVCLVDLDLAFGDVAISLRIVPAHTIADAVPMGAGLDVSGLESLLTRYSDGVTTLVAPTQPDARELIPTELVGRILDLLKQMFDFVVVDTAPTFDETILMAFDHSDLLLLLLTLDVPAVKATKITLETLDLLNYPRDKCRLVLNRADPRVGLSVDEVETALHSALSVTVAASREVAASTNRGEPVCLTHPKHPVTQSLRTLADLCVDSLAVPVAEPSEPAGGQHRRRSRFARKSTA